MTTINFGAWEYPGIQVYDSVRFTDVSGISPSVCVVRVFPQYGWPDRIGDMVFTYNAHQIVIPGCTIDNASFQRNSGGKIVSVRILDSRWRWAYGQITLRANVRLPNNFVDPLHEKTPQEIATLCFIAMGETSFDVSALPSDARPDIDWESENPAQCLAQMCDDLGCRIVPRRSDATWVICQTGVGNPLPDNLPYQDGGDGIDPKEIPDFLQIVTAPVNYQVALPMEPIGRDLDQSWLPAQELSYCPNPDNTYDVAYGCGLEPSTMCNLSNTRVLQADGTAVSAREIARTYLYRSWRIKTPFSNGQRLILGFPTMYINGYDGYVCRKQIILTDKLAQCYTDERGEIHPRPAYMFGEFESRVSPQINYPPGTRIDYQSPNVDKYPEERSSFNLNADPLDTDRSIVTTSRQMTFITKNIAQPDGTTRTRYDFAKLFYVCAIQIRDPDTWQPIRYFRFRQISDSPNPDPTNVATIVKNDIQPWFINLYNPDGTWSSNTNNSDDVNNQCDYYLDQIQQTFMTISTQTRTYIGLFPIDMDGAIQQVTYEIGKRGTNTI